MLKCILVADLSERTVENINSKKFVELVKDFAKRADMFLLVACVITTIIGIIAIHSATLSYETNKFIIVQGFSLIIGIGAYVLFTIIDVDLIAEKWVYLCVFNFLLIGSLIIFGHDDGTGNRAWIRFAGIGIQPSEIAKIVFIVLMAKHMTFLKERHQLNQFKGVIQLGIHWFALFAWVVAISSDLGSALILFAIFLVMLIAAGVAWYWLGAAAAAVAAMIPLAWKFALHDYQKQRIIAPYAPEIVDPDGTGITWQTNQSRAALASGRLNGLGYGQGIKTQTNALPAKHTDCIFASIGEEMGMIVCILIIVLLTVIIIRCCVVGVRSGSTFGMLICFGVAAALAFQTFINIGMCIGITPVIGITLPFISYGGSSVVTLFAAVGLVSGVKYRPKPQRYMISI